MTANERISEQECPNQSITCDEGSPRLSREFRTLTISHIFVFSLAEIISDPYCINRASTTEILVLTTNGVRDPHVFWGIMATFKICASSLWLEYSSSLSSEDVECAKSKNPYNPLSIDEKMIPSQSVSFWYLKFNGFAPSVL